MAKFHIETYITNKFDRVTDENYKSMFGLTLKSLALYLNERIYEESTSKFQKAIRNCLWTLFYFRNSPKVRVCALFFRESKTTMMNGINKGIEYLILVDTICLDDRQNNQYVEFGDSKVYTAVDTTDIPIKAWKELKDVGHKTYSMKNKQDSVKYLKCFPH
eukprot:TRINITY_DN2104_c0_g1_i4.p1 TRINITY_DN2104_c0_g1~~TRINITY_DN2104_c0_g1_i4.p1  ORF type:complete len:161 (+),score=12.34 TRINITY_DN2104_c0_g1_i4:28-510(+)